MLHHIDTCCIPDYAIRAIENWGLITNQQSTLLVGTSSAIVVHGLAN